MSVIFSLKLDELKLGELDDYISEINASRESLIAVLHKAQGIFGYLPKELQLYVARKLDIPASKVNGVVSFYSYFSQEKRGEYTISICMGTACFVRGSEPVLDEFAKVLDIQGGQTTSDGLFTLRDVRCVGACGLAPVVMINDKVYGHVSKDDVATIVDEYKKKGAQNEN